MKSLPTPTVIVTDDVAVGGNSPLLLIAGPCVIEKKDTCLKIAESLIDISDKLEINLIFKASFDKANRTSIDSYRGPGLEKGLKILSEIKETYCIPVTSDIHLPSQAEEAAKVLDLIQIPAYLCRQTDLVISAAVTDKAVNVKKGQFLSPKELGNVIGKLNSAKNHRVLVTERGTSFGYNRLVNDFAGLPVMRAMGVPVLFDATHSVQRPGSDGDSSGGNRSGVECLARAAAGAGIDGIFVETHPDPDKAKCDGPNMVPLDELEELLKPVIEIDNIVRR